MMPVTDDACLKLKSIYIKINSLLLKNDRLVFV